jgi:hypothetical protein
MAAEGVIGAGILGQLNYQETSQGWAIELGQWLGTYIIVFTREHTAGVDDIVSTRQTTATNINQILSRHNIPLTVSNDLASNGDGAVRTASALLDIVQFLNGAAICALVLIGQCALSLSVASPGTATDTINAYLEDINHRCSELGIACEAFGRILLQQGANGLSATAISRLMVHLSRPLSVLIMSSDPRNADRLRLAEERRELGDAIQRSRFRGSLNLHDVVGCRVQDIAFALDTYDPNVLHFSGHGNNSGLFFENNRGEAVAVETSALASLLGTQRNLRLVILNACYSLNQGQAIADAVGHVIAMEGSILDEDSITFSREFYAALGHGRTFEGAFDRAERAVGLTTSLKPHLLTRTRVDAMMD